MTPVSTAPDPRRLPFARCLAAIEAAQAQWAGASAPGAIAGDQSPLQAALDQLQAQFDQQIQPLAFDDWPPSQRSLLTSLRVEMHKQLRLLTTDLMFLQAARQAETAQQRLGQVGDRLTTLAGYCTAVLDAPVLD